MAEHVLELIKDKMVLPIYSDTYNRNKTKEAAKQFITEHDLHEIWTKPQLKQFFIAHGIELSGEDLDTIRMESIRALSTLVLVGCDGMKAWTETLKALFTPPHHLEDSRLPLEEKCVIKGLTVHKLGNFVKRQFETLPVTFDEANGSMEISSLFLLPIVSSESVTRGAYGQVFKIRIPKGYHRRADGYTNSDSRVFARKKLPKNHGQKEGKNLRELQDSLKSHSHIMTHQAMFIYEGEYNILYDWADCDLRCLLDLAHSAFLDSPGAPRRVLEEASNLIGALSFLHRDLVLPVVGSCICCHMDLKPENILVFFYGDSFSLKISDLGVSKIKADPHSDSRPNHQEFNPKKPQLTPDLRKLTPRTTKTTPGRGHGQFQAPEMNQPRVGRSSDVWSMGCILIVMIIRTFEGIKVLEQFEKVEIMTSNDYFHYKDEGGKTDIKPAVKEWLTRIERGPSAYVKALRELRMEQDETVVILKPLAELIGESLKIDGKKRIKSNQFYSRLQRIVNSLPQFQTLLESREGREDEDGTKMLTISHLRTYKKLFNTCQVSHEASFDLFQRHFRRELGVSVIQKAWYLAADGQAPGLDIHQTSAAAFLIQLHILEKINLVQLSSTEIVQKVDHRGGLIFRRFAKWVQCNCCKCETSTQGLDWNFIHPMGLWRGPNESSETRCVAIAFLRRGSSSQVGSYSQEEFDKMKIAWEN